MITVADYIVIALYFAFIIAVGWVFRKFLSNTSDYFRGGGKMHWWMVGSSAFMTQFSAWTFIAAAGKAYDDGLIILTIFIANAVGFLVSYFCIAPMLRQTRVVTGMQAVRQRLGPVNEQFYTWLQIPIGLIFASMWLNALGKFLAQAFPAFELTWTIIGVGGVVLLVSVVGGAWAVSATDFVQLVLLMLVAIIMATFSLFAVGGPIELFRNLPHESPILGSDITLPPLIWLWIAMVFIKQIVSVNSLTNANRYLNARDSRHARLGALLSAILFVAGSIIWFIPPLAASILYPDLNAFLTTEVSRPSELAYVITAQNLLPAGMIGLLIVGIFAATMSSMDSGLNKNAGYFVMNFYKPVIRRQASERELFLVGIITTVVMGILVICLALYLEVLEMGLFEIMLNFGAMVALPVGIPVLLCMFIRNTPDWAAWSSALVGVVVYVLTTYLFNAEWFEGVIGTEISSRERSEYVYSASVVLNVIFATGLFLLSKRFYKPMKPQRQKEVDDFFDNLNRPVENSEMSSELDVPQNRIIGWMATAFGGFMLLLMLVIPNTMAGRLSFLFCAVCLGGIGAFLLYTARKLEKRIALPRV